ncbi:sulfatase [Thalassoglobus sp. JC818]|uniref:sulfatase n=1 Tax=Thalassoglobus sp. JC818 TaxID=3232136 RepID=UPI00345B1305
MRILLKSLFVAVLLCAASRTSESADQWNVLFIAADDLNCSLGCYGNQDVSSPHLDRLASSGTLFENAYCQQAVCNPSRASLMSGLRPDTISVYDLRTDFRTAQPDAVTIPQRFKNNGYFTRCIGKMFHNMGDLDDEPSWSVPSMLNAGRHSDTYAIIPEGKKPGSKLGAHESEDLPDETYRDGKIADLACQQLREFSDEPFFLAVGFWRPHLPFLAPKKYWDRYQRDSLTLPDRFAPPSNVPEIALHDSRELKGYGPDPQNMSAEERRLLWHGYYASISYLDDQVGKLLKTLEETGLRDKTIVVFWSDHGFHLGQHSLWCKTSCFELDARVPLLISAPGFPEDNRTSSVVELIDLSPTLAELCGLPDVDIEGESLVPMMKDPSTSVKKVAITQHPRPAYFKAVPEQMGYSVTDGRFRYTEWRDWRTGNVTATELYDHEKDPNEMENLIGSNQYSEAVEQLRNELVQVAPNEPHE